MLPAPIVSTTSPSRTMPASAVGNSSMLFSSTGSTRPRERIARHNAFAVGAGDRRLAGGVHLVDDERVGVGEHLRELVEQVARARVAMRLEGEHDAAAGPALAGGLDRRGDLGRVMAVVVDERDACRCAVATVAEELQPALDALEAGERALDRAVVDLELGRDGDRRERIQHVVPARQVERDVQRRIARRTDHVEVAIAALRARRSTARTSACVVEAVA